MQAGLYNLIQNVTAKWSSISFFSSSACWNNIGQLQLSELSIKSSERLLDVTTKKWNLFAELNSVLQLA